MNKIGIILPVLILALFLSLISARNPSLNRLETVCMDYLKNKEYPDYIKLIVIDTLLIKENKYKEEITSINIDKIKTHGPLVSFGNTPSLKNRIENDTVTILVGTVNKPRWFAGINKVDILYQCGILCAEEYRYYFITMFGKDFYLFKNFKGVA